MHTHRGGGCVKETETRLMLPQAAQEWREPPKPEEAWKNAPLAGTLISDFGLQNCERTNFCCFKLPTLWYFVCYNHPWMLMYKANGVTKERPTVGHFSATLWNNSRDWLHRRDNTGKRAGMHPLCPAAVYGSPYLFLGVFQREGVPKVGGYDSVPHPPLGEVW